MGKAVAWSLAREGARVALCARTEAALTSAAAEIREETGGEVLPVACDVTDERAIEAFLKAVAGRLGPVEILVNNAGGPPPGNFEETEDAGWDLAHRLTLRSAIAFCRRVVPGMKQRHWGRILSITSLTVKQPQPYLILSNTYRAALTGFSKTLAGEVAPFGITVNCVCPGYTDTERLGELTRRNAAKEGVDPAEIRARLESSVPAGRLGKPEEVGDLIAFLASERAGYITGVSILIDGGFVRALV
jgi:3-oxoacyl-[acyl-carrier protein] reductase